MWQTGFSFEEILHLGLFYAPLEERHRPRDGHKTEVYQVYFSVLLGPRSPRHQHPLGEFMLQRHTVERKAQF